jgi:acyl-coenzyme A thioesterase PaaI-like protein
MNQPNTHLSIDAELCGEPLELGPGTASAQLQTTQRMAADTRGLVHGGFIFGLADYAAMLAVNDPHVVLGAADTRFLAPVCAGDVVHAHATVVAEKGKKRVVEATASVGDITVFTGTFTTFVLEKHVLDK